MSSEASEKKADEATDDVFYEWFLPLNILLATAPQGAMGRPVWSVANGLQYELGF